MITPQNDFYLSVNSEWLENNPVANDYSCWGSFHVLANETLLKLKDILDNDNLGDEWQKVKLIWKPKSRHSTSKLKLRNSTSKPFFFSISTSAT